MGGRWRISALDIPACCQRGKPGEDVADQVPRRACGRLRGAVPDSPQHPAQVQFHPHFTPASLSWLNLVERWFAELTRRKPCRSAHRSMTQLEAGIRRWISEWNAGPKPFIWTQTADEILESAASYRQRTTTS